MRDKLFKNTFILTLATMLSKLLGFIYVIPFVYLVGLQGNILLEYAYKPYIILLSLATMGVPSAMAKKIAMYRELNQEKQIKMLFTSGVVFMGLSGVIAATVLFLTAPQIAKMLIVSKDQGGNSIQDVVFVLRMVCFALIVVPLMAIIRGYFQGFENFVPTAISQVVEQLFRILFILGSCYWVIKVNHGSVVQAVGWSVFAATVGAIAGLVVLIGYMKRDRVQWFFSTKDLVEHSKTFVKLMKTAVPFVMVALSIPVYQTIETYFLNGALVKTGLSFIEAETFNSLIAMAQKLILIPVSLATAMSLTLMPTVVGCYTSGDLIRTRKIIRKSFLFLMAAMIPATIVTMVGSHLLFTLFFGSGAADKGAEVLFWYAPTMILYAVLLVQSAIKQGVRQEKWLIICVVVGLAVKGATTYWAVQKWGYLGTIWTTDLGLIITCVLLQWKKVN
jgi:O-antigen/teichoic acid export membrane protein